MAPKTTKSSKRKPSTRRLTNVDYFEAVFQKIYADVALRVSEKGTGSYPAKESQTITGGWRSHLLRRALPIQSASSTLKFGCKHPHQLLGTQNQL